MKPLHSRRDFLKTSASMAGLFLLRFPAWAAQDWPRRTIHPYPNKVAWGDGTLRLSKRVTLAIGGDCDAAMMKDLWQRFTFGAVKLDVTKDAALKPGEFSLGGARPPQREPNDTYALAATDAGIAASSVDAASARHAWFTLLQLLQPSGTGVSPVHSGIPAAQTGGTPVPLDLSFAVPHVEIHDWPALKFRGLHLCIFHETTPLMIEKAIRLAAFFKFTHVVLEFWGMLKLDALKELSWPDAWTKADAGKLVRIARSMGMEVIPMFNSWGHATSCRVRHGRHVVLDQNPRLAPLFEPDGWTWCLTNPRTQDLLQRVHDELMEFAGPGQYFHIGCDEAYSHATCDRCRQTDHVQLFAEHINNLAAHIEKRGRRAMMWGDPLLERAKWPTGFSANGTPTLPTHLALDRISRKIIINDWHYGVTGDVPTLAHFREHGFETIACPWNSTANIRALSKAAVVNKSDGVLMTTWHHLAKSIPVLHYTAACVWSKNQSAQSGALALTTTAALLRKLVPADGKFDRAGWNLFEQPFEID